RIDPRAFANRRSKEPQLRAGPTALADDACVRKTGLEGRALDQRVAERFDLGGDRLEKSGACLGREPTILGEGLRGGIDRADHFGRVRLMENRLERCAGCGVVGAERYAAGLAGLSRNHALAMQGHAVSWFVVRRKRLRVRFTRPYSSKSQRARS